VLTMIFLLSPLLSVAAEGIAGATVPTATGLEVKVKPTEPVHVRGGKDGFMFRPIWRSTNKPSEKSQFADWWDRNDFRDSTALDVLEENRATLRTSAELAEAEIVGMRKVSTRQRRWRSTRRRQ
jgi:hypothetical protein